MDQSQNPTEGKDAGWRERCNKMISERLKEEESAIWDSPSQSFEKKFMIFELYQSVQYEKPDMFVHKLLKRCFETRLRLSQFFDQVTSTGDSLLHVAAHFGAEEIAELIAYYFPELLTKRNIKGDTPLHVASRAKNSNIIKLILSQAARNSNSFGGNDEDGLITRLTNEHGNTALHEAVGADHFDSVSELFGADKPTAHYRNKLGESPLYIAVLSSNMNIVDLLWSGPFTASSGSYGVSPLHAAILKKDPVLLSKILSKNPELIYLTAEDGGTALHYAALTDYPAGVHILLNQSTSETLLIHKRDNNENLPIHLACEKGHVKVVKEFIKKGWPNIKDLLNLEGQNMLHIAANNGRDNVVKYLLRDAGLEKVTINERDNHGNTALHWASDKCDPEILFHLTQDKRVNVNIKNNDNCTAYDLLVNSSAMESAFQKGIALAILYQNGARPSGKANRRLWDQEVSPEVKTNKTEKSTVVDWIKDASNTVMLIAILIATVTFAAGFTVPGSVYSSDENDPQKRGLAVLANKTSFQMFMICNTIAMYSSTTGCIILLWASVGDFYAAVRSYFYGLYMVGLALVTMSLAFMAAIRLVVSNVTWLANLITVIAALFFFLIFVIFIVLIFPVGSRIPGLRKLSNVVLRVVLWFRKFNQDPSLTS